MSDLVYSIVNEGHCFKPFNCGDDDLNDFLLNSSKEYQKEFLATTYVIENDIETIAFFSIFNDGLKVEDVHPSKSALKRFIKSILPHGKRHLNNYPAIKIGRLAVSLNSQRGSIGTKIINTVINYAINQNDYCGCKFIIVDAYKASISFYQKNNFVFLTSKDSEKDTRQMYLNLTPYNNYSVKD
jgi:hypothetical protein